MTDEEIGWPRTIPPDPWSEDLTEVFSPRSGLKVLDWYAQLAGTNANDENMLVIRNGELTALRGIEIEHAAERILAEYDTGHANDIFAERGTAWLTVEDAYAVQRAVAEVRRARG